MNLGLKKLYERENEFREVRVCDEENVRLDPANIKYAAEVAAAGGTHRFDLRIVSEATPKDSVIRVYTFDDDTITGAMFLMSGSGEFRQFPAKAWMSYDTRFDDGHVLITLNSGSGFRMPRMPGFTTRFRGDVSDPTELLQHHREVCARLTGEGRRALGAPTTADAAFARMRQDHQRTVEFYANRDAYTWGDALHEAFGVVRRQFRERGGRPAGR
jgi:hypothetical protein